MIEMEAVVKTFHKMQALKGVSLTMAPGDRVALIGANGSGKTTLIRCLLGLHEFSGRVMVFGDDVRGARQQVLRQVAFVPQYAPALRLTVAEYLRLARDLCGCRPEAVRLIAARLGLDLDGCKSRLFRKLSGGMQRKLLIATAFARGPRVLLLDEPATSLDPAARGVFFELLAELPASTILVMSSHRVDELAGLVGRVVELDGGLVSSDEQVSMASRTDDLAQRFTCRVLVRDPSPAVAQGLTAWGLTPRQTDAGWEWLGSVPGPDRFRLLTSLARWSSVLEAFALERA